MICNKVYEFLKHDSNTNTKHCILTFKVQNETVVVKFRVVVTVGEGKVHKDYEETCEGFRVPTVFYFLTKVMITQSSYADNSSNCTWIFSILFCGFFLNNKRF